MVPIDTYEALGRSEKKVGAAVVFVTFRSSASNAFLFESRISSTISWVDWTLPFYSTRG